MNELLFVIGGWLGMLSRLSLLLQLGIGVGLLLAYRGWKLRHRHQRSSWRPLVAKLVLVAQLVAIWTGLAALRLLLRRWFNHREVEGYWRRRWYRCTPCWRWWGWCSASMASKRSAGHRCCSSSISPLISARCWY